MSIFDYKKPKTNDNYVGIEIECLSPFSQNQLANRLVKSPLACVLTLDEDASLKSDYAKEVANLSIYCAHCGEGHYFEDGDLTLFESNKCVNCKKQLVIPEALQKKMKTYENLPIFTHEIKVLIKEKNLLSDMKKLTVLLKDIKASVNDSCGLHVHLDMRNRKPEKCFARLVKAQPVLWKMIKPNRKTSKYCKPIPAGSMWDPTGDGTGDRRSAINQEAYPRHKTIEIRMHHGTVDTKEITRWVSTLIKVIGKGQELTAAKRAA